MKAYTTNIYPVFEADQVLSQKELNQLISHLEEQDRITRKNLTGIGAVCGLELSFPTANSVKIECGTAVTSLGFQINWKEQTFTHFHDYELSEQFLKPDYIDEPHLEPIFKHTKQYEPIKNCIELLVSNSKVAGNKPIPTNLFTDKVIVLLLEVTLIDIKNCITTNCDDKGKRIEFIIRPILVPISESTKAIIPEYEGMVSHARISLPRYNVPVTNLVTGTDILKGFEKIYDDSLLTQISSAINGVYQDLKHLLPAYTLQNVKAKIKATVNMHKSGANIQYLWDWISDIAQAYNEIVEFEEINRNLCCVDETLFPFHVALGTKSSNSNNYRTPFFKTLNATTEEKIKLKKLTMLFDRLVLVLNSFNVNSSAIKITPSHYGDKCLAEKSIPFYYDQVLELNKKWSPELTLKNQNDTILSYHSNLPNYTNKAEVKTPLKFDIEPYNFFRIEGHIGHGYLSAITEIQTKIQVNRLPFKVVAINAVDEKGRTLKTALQNGLWDDLEFDYDLAKEKVYNISEYVIIWIKTNKTKIQEKYALMTDLVVSDLEEILVETRKLLSDDLKTFLPNYEAFMEVFEGLNDLFLSHRKCITDFSIGVNEPIIEDFIDHLDEINTLFLEDAFTVIQEEVERRWKESLKETFFSNFIKKHPAIEHKAGVKASGTFVLVYSDYSVFNSTGPTIRTDSILNRLKNYATLFNFTTAEKEEIKKSNIVRTKKLAKRKAAIPIEINDTNRKTAVDVSNKLIENAKQNIKTNFPTATQAYMLEQLEAVFDIGVIVSPELVNPDSTPQKIILADFYLPYICCGEGYNLNFIVETDTVPQAGDFLNSDFNNNDFNTNK